MSVASLAVAPSAPRSMAMPVFEKISLVWMVLPIPVVLSSTPFWRLKAMRFG
ncbi:hypothetical protein D3C83_202930 [compost metagenome]